ncbi:MAG: hypothetical protein OJF48_000535 [Afipia sp.]|jgi:hypothetical protein|nr:MAG: hypothetical protein OJF48_000535 [Afipia sp.]
MDSSRQSRGPLVFDPSHFRFGVPIRKVTSMQQYDLYINAKKPAIGLYVRKGTNLPDLADKADWVFDGSAAQDLLPPSVIEGVAASGHAFRDMD